METDTTHRIHVSRLCQKGACVLEPLPRGAAVEDQKDLKPGDLHLCLSTASHLLCVLRHVTSPSESWFNALEREACNMYPPHTVSLDLRSAL